jgi:hypothetical protein
MLTLIRSNRVEYLLAELAGRLVSEPPASAFSERGREGTSPTCAGAVLCS